VVTTDAAGKLAAGADVAGIHTTPDGGSNWSSGHGNVKDPLQMSVASIAYSSETQNLVYAAYGVRVPANKGGFQRSTDGGLTWARLTDDLDGLVFQGQGANFSGGPFTGNPTIVRSTGNLIVLDESPLNKFYVGTYDGGVYRSGDGGSSWITIELGPGSPQCAAWGACYIRSLVAQPGDLTTLYVGTYGNGVFKITGANGNSRVVTLLTPPSLQYAEELAFDISAVPPTLYCACGDSGIARALGPNYDTWTLVNTGIESGPEWDAIAAGGGFIYAGANDPVLVSGAHRAVKKLPSGGTQWTDIVTSDNVNPVVWGTSTRWWLADASEGSYLLGGFRSDVSMLQAVGTIVYAAGRSGVWRWDGAEWRPTVRGLGLTAPKDLATSSLLADQQRVYIGSTDWTYFWSTDEATSVSQQEVNMPGATYGFYVAVDPYDTFQHADTYLGVGAGSPDMIGTDEDFHGEVFKNTNPAGGVWNTMDLSSKTTADKCEDPTIRGRPIGLVIGRQGATTMVVAAVDGCGLWRWDSISGIWGQVKGWGSVLGNQAVEKAPLAWPKTATPNYVYVLDRTTRELWRSNDYGSFGSWQIFWEVPALEPPLTDGSGYIAADPTVQGWVWVTTEASDGTWLLIDIDGNGLDCLPIKYTSPIDPGPIAIRPGTRDVYIATRQTTAPGSLPKFWKGTVSGTNCVDVSVSWTQSSDVIYQQAAVFPRALSWGNPDTYVHVGLGGQGAVKVSGLP
jgi:hypothetical protein